jgi:hypothetical protein
MLDINNPKDPIFFIISGGMSIEVLRSVLISLIAIGAFIAVPKDGYFRIFLGIMGASLLITGGVGSYINTFDYTLNFIKPLDLLLIFQMGIMLSILALEPQRQRMPILPHVFLASLSSRPKKLRVTA